eukprot:SM009440S25043  [mRNA]  locus=s9440:56:286:- [translate_table: standard]
MADLAAAVAESEDRILAGGPRDRIAALDGSLAPALRQLSELTAAMAVVKEPLVWLHASCAASGRAALLSIAHVGPG